MSETKKPSRRRRLIALAVIASIFLMLLFLGYLLISIDDDPPDDRDVAPGKWIAIPEGDNAYPLLRQAHRKLELPDDFYDIEGAFHELDLSTRERPAEEWTRALELVEMAGPHLELVRQALERPEYQSEQVLSFAQSIPHIMEYRNYANLLQLRSRVRFLQGDERGAFADLELGLALGRRVSGSPQTLVEFVIGQSMVGTAAAGYREIVPHASLDDAELAAIQESLRISGLENGLIQALKSEYGVVRVFLQALARGEGDPRDLDLPAFAALSFKPNRTLRRFVEFYRTTIAAVEKGALPSAAPPTSPGGFLSHLRLFLSGNYSGETLVSLMGPAVGHITTRALRTRANLEATRYLIALYRYRKRHGELPVDASALVPDFLDAVPVDPFGGQPLRYSPGKKIVYSIGNDLKDDGGAMGESRDEAEPTFEIWTPAAEGDAADDVKPRG